MSSSTLVEEAYVHHLSLEGEPEGSRIAFRAVIWISVTLVYEREGGPSTTFPGEVAGHIGVDGIVLDDVTVDTSSFYE